MKQSSALSFDNPSGMNPNSKQRLAELDSSGTSTILMDSSDVNGGVLGQRKMAGFASIINLKEEGVATVTRGRRIQISQLGPGGTNKTQVKEEEGPALKKRWSFHSANQIADILKEDKAMKPIVSPKRRKSSGSSLAKAVSDPYAFSDEHLHRKGYSQISLSKELSQKPRHVLGSRQSHSLHRHHQRRSKLVPLPLDECEPSSSKGRQRHMDEFLMQAEPYPTGYHQFRMRSKKVSREPVIPDRISPLPDEVLLRIFKHLPKTSLASLGRSSQRFLKIVQDESLWKRLCVMGKILNPEHLLIIMSRKPVYLRMARTSIADPVEVPSDLSSLSSSSQLLFLDLSSAHITTSTLALIMKISPKLIKLSLEHLEITKEVLESMMSFVSTIEVLNLTMCYYLDAQLLVKFLTSCKRLKELNMGCMKVDWGIEDLTAVCNALPRTVQQLNMSGFRNLLDNTHVEIISTRCPKLIELDISDSQEVQAKSIDYFLRLTHLQHLGLSRCYGIEPPLYTGLSSHKSLKYLDLFSLFKENSIRQLSSNLPGIEINKFPFSAIARPTVGNKRSSIWLQRVRD